MPISIYNNHIHNDDYDSQMVYDNDI